jgi:cyclohexanone monooxygenase
VVRAVADECLESYVYMPLLEETGYIPSEKYAKAAELQEHCRRIGKHFGLYEKAIFHAEARELTWDEEASHWIVRTDRGDTIRARFVATASGPLNMPKLPGVEGIEKYKGHSFHTSRWDYEYTGGNIRGHLDKIKDKRIGIIGTGATAIQAVPHLGAGVEGGAGHLYVFQRTPSSVDVRANRPTDPEWARSLKPGWQEDRMVNFIEAMNGKVVDEEDMVNDGWTKGPKKLKKMGIDRRDKASLLENAALYELADMQVMEGIRARCNEIVKDRKTAEALKPWYRRFCKRPCFHDEYLHTFNIPNVTLVDTNGKGIERVTERGIVVNGQEYELDCIIYSTGFEVGTDYSRRSNFKVTGKNSVELSEHWKDGWHTFHGFHTRGFPNLFVISVVQSGFAANFVHMLNEQSKHIGYIVKTCKERGIKSVEVTQEAVDAWVNKIIEGSWLSAGFQKECTPGYYNLEGQITESVKAKRQGNYPAGPLGFAKCLKEWQEKGDLEGLETVKDETVWKEC